MRKITVQLFAVLCLLALAGCQPTTSTPAATPRPTISPTPAPVQVSLFAVSQQHTVVALNPADGSVRWRHPLTSSVDSIAPFLAVQDAVFFQTNQPFTPLITALNASDGKERWHTSNFGGLVAVGDGTVQTVYGSTLSGLSAVDGKRLWSLPMQGVVVASLVGGIVYALDDVSLHALDARTGKERWSVQQAGITQAGRVQALAVTQESVYVTAEAPNGTSDTLFALHQSDGQVRWHLPSPNADFYMWPTEVNGVVYVAVNGHDNNGCTESPRTYPPATLYALSASDGKPLWHSHPSQAGVVFVDPIVDQGVLYSADVQHAYAFNTADGQQLWSAQILQSSDVPLTQIAQPIISGGLVYLSVGFCGFAQTGPVSFWALNKSDGHVVWQYRGSQRSDNQTAPLVLNGVVYVTTATGDVEALNGSDGKQLWQDTTFLTNLASNAG